MTFPALVTGADREGGIGRAIVERLEADGMEVLTLDKEPGATSTSRAPSASATLPNGFFDPADIANGVAFFASPASGMVTGQPLTIDGGDQLNIRSVISSVVRR